MALQKLVLENFTGGINYLSKYYGQNSYQSGVGIAPHLRTESLGDTSPGWTSSQLGAATVATNISKFVPVDDATTRAIYAYSPTKIYEISATNGTVSTGTYPLTITNGVTNGGMTYFKNRLLYANSSTQVGIFTPGATPAQTDNKFTGFTSDTTRRHFAVGFETCYISNSNNIATITDPTNAATLNTAALDLPTGTIITDIKFWRDTIVIAGKISTSTGASVVNEGARIYFWDGFSESWFAEFPLPEANIRNLMLWKGTIFAQGDNFIYRYTGSGFEEWISIQPGTGRINMRPNGVEAGSLDIFKSSLVYPNNDGDVISIGNLDPGAAPVITVPFKAPADVEHSIFANADEVFYGTSNGKLYWYDSANNRETGVTLSTNELIFDSPVHIVGMRLNFQPLAAGDSMTVNYIDASTTTTTQVGTITQAADGGSISSKYIQPSSNIRTNAGRFDFVFNAGSMALKPKIVVYYEPIPEPFHAAV